MTGRREINSHGKTDVCHCLGSQIRHLGPNRVTLVTGRFFTARFLLLEFATDDIENGTGLRLRLLAQGLGSRLIDEAFLPPGYLDLIFCQLFCGYLEALMFRLPLLVLFVSSDVVRPFRHFLNDFTLLESKQAYEKLFRVDLSASEDLDRDMKVLGHKEGLGHLYSNWGHSN